MSVAGYFQKQGPELKMPKLEECRIKPVQPEEDRPAEGAVSSIPGTLL